MLKGLFYSVFLGLICSTAVAQDLSTRRIKASKKRAHITLDENNNPVPKKVESIYFNLGAHTEFYNGVQIDDSGGLRKIDYKPTLGAGLVMPFHSLKFLPEFNWVLPQKAGSSKIIKNLFMFRGDLGYEPIDWLRMRIGTSLMWGNQHGSGGAAKVNNGNSTSTFYYPDENRSTLNNTLDVGVETKLEDWSVRFQTYIYSVFKEERRQISYTIFVSYYWDQ